MQQKLAMKDYLYLGSMLFGLFFGAGNLIFPVNMGQQAGANIFLANLGFLTTAIGLPFLGIIAVGISKTNGLFDIATRVNRTYAYIFTILLYLVIGPFFALPRLATTSFEISIMPFVASHNQTLYLAIFSIVFFLCAWFLALKPGKLLDYVGKYLNPIFLILLAILLVMAFIHPLGQVSHGVVQSMYTGQPFFTGFLQGYNTLDALASLAFGIIIVTSIRNRGVTQPGAIAIDTFKSGAVSIALMGIIYTLLSYLGAMSIGHFKLSANGGIALAQVAQYYLGPIGSILLALIIIVACLKTAVGLISAFSQTFIELFPGKSYVMIATVVSILPAIFANVGLTNIIAYSVPVLMFLYPLAITLIILTIFSPLFHNDSRVYQVTTYLTLIAGLVAGLKASPTFISQAKPILAITNFADHYLPFEVIGMGWIVPGIIGAIIGLIWHFSAKKTGFSMNQ
ncbi:branched-chain amino acid transport system II carrier protein [Periweissella fabalis]|uniref:Branched-chain amino acid transport system carrier protein n=1 Tax=Periweissella fabalis TaxID=1070421 RepID=A0A7X6S4J0_9LACO|nr:branched-chain amino acid transport system II carrier protein [Periweissella fabalis]MCM0598427.1 branched-chain amino acid transport system II carrier protein [Periweissella fabalis]NKZ25052.1 branched-chain amino acid transport system II carrier protein [Periweissella fabalis]